MTFPHFPLAVIPAVAGPLQVLLTLLPGLLLAFFAALASLVRPKTALMAAKLAWRLKWQLAAITLVVVGIGYGVWQLPTLVQAESNLAETKGKDFPTTRGNQHRTAVADDVAAPNRAGRNWTWRNGDAAIFSSPAVVGNRVYFSTAHLAVVGDGTGEIIALDADTGKLAWRSAPLNYRATFSSPVVAGDKLVVGEGLHTVVDARVVCLDLREDRQGDVLWTHRTAGHVESTPLIHNGRVYVGAGDDGVYCLDLNGNDKGETKVIWHADGKRCIDVETTPVVWKNKAGQEFVIACLGVDGQAIVALDSATGEEVGRVTTDHPIFGIPAVHKDQLFVGMGVGDMVRTAEELSKQPAGEVFAVDLNKLSDAKKFPEKNAALLWRFKAERTILGAVAVHQDRLYFCSRDQHVYCLNLDGELQNKWNAGSPMATSPAVTDDYVYVVTNSGMLYAVNRSTLTPLWETRVGAKPTFVSSPTVARGQIFVGTQFDGFCSVGKADTQQLAPLWPTALAGQGGNPANEPLPPTGAFQWQYPTDQEGESEAAVVAAPIAAADHQIVVSVADEETPGLVCLPYNATKETPDPIWKFTTRHPVTTSPAISGDYVLAVDGEIGKSGRSLYCIDRTTGKPKWKVIVSTFADGAFCATHHHVLVQDAPGRLASRDLANRGMKRWAADVGEISQPPVSAGAIAIVAADKPPMLFALDQGTGKTLWKQPLEQPPASPIVVHETTIFLPTKLGLKTYSLLSGEAAKTWANSADIPAGPIVVDRQGVAFVNTKNEVIVAAHAGKVAARHSGAVPGFSPLVTSENILFACKDDLKIAPRGKGEAKQWLDTSWLGKPATSLVLYRGGIYQGRTGWGIVRLGAAR